jgi:hypothetical protein
MNDQFVVSTLRVGWPVFFILALAVVNQVQSASHVIQQHPGVVTLSEQDGVFSVTDAEGQLQYAGGEVSAEFAYWQVVFEVPAEDVEVVQ